MNHLEIQPILKDLSINMMSLLRYSSSSFIETRNKQLGSCTI